MDSFELNKMVGAALATALLVMALSITSEIIYEPADLRENGYVIAVSETDEGSSPEAVAAIAPIAVRLQTADASAGETSAKKCLACHTFNEGGPPKVGPNLYGVVTREAAHVEGFNYSAALREQAAEGLAWSYEDLDEFLESPKADVPGTIMAFAGLRKPEERANVIAYLRTLSGSPEPLPEPPVEAAPEGEVMPDAEGAEASGAAPDSETAITPSATTEMPATPSEATPLEAMPPGAIPLDTMAPESEGGDASQDAPMTPEAEQQEAPAAPLAPVVAPETPAPATESAQ